MPRISLALGLLTSIAFSMVAWAGPAYNAKDVVNTLGPARGVCIDDPDGIDQRSFDLLINFDFNSDALTASAKENLKQFALALEDPRLQCMRFQVEGYTDSIGPEEYNLELSKRRAREVVRYLTSLGVESARLVYYGYGETRPRTQNPDDAVNRRVETRVAQ